MRALVGACACACVVGAYVSSLRVARGDRDDPRVIARRMLATGASACVACVVACVVARASAGAGGAWRTYAWRELGLAPAKGHARACGVGVGTATCALAGEWTRGTRRRRRLAELRGVRNAWTVARDFVHAPLVEEFVFRACAWTTMRGSGASARAAGGWSTALFAAAHAHHYFGARARGISRSASPSTSALGFRARASRADPPPPPRA